MLSRIEIRNFKAIRDGIDENGETVEKPLVLDNLSKVNYLVGKNGSGKSSVLEAIYKKIIGNKNSFIKNLPELMSPDENGKFPWVDVFNQQGDRLEFGVGGGDDLEEKVLFINQKTQLFTQYVIEQNEKELNLRLCETVLIRHGYVDWNIFKSLYLNTLTKEDKKLSDGELAKKTFFYILKLFEKDKDEAVEGGLFPDRSIVLIEEPEQFLHPDWQKQIQSWFIEWNERIFVNAMYENNEPSDITKSHAFMARYIIDNSPNVPAYTGKNNSTQFFISTHSPFIIAESGKLTGNDKQNVYMIDDGQIVDKNGINQWEADFDSQATIGYSGNQVASVVAKMLGAEGADLGYPDNYILVEESSKQSFLEALFERDEFRKNIVVISSTPGGDNGLLKSHEHIKDLLKTNPLLKSNPIFSKKYIVFTDYVDEYYNENNQKYISESQKNNGGNDHKRAMHIKQSLGERFIAEHDEFEKYYPENILNVILTEKGYSNWDRSKTFSEFLKVKEVDNIGFEKSEIAKLVAARITIDQFKTNFEKLYNSIFGEV